MRAAAGCFRGGVEGEGLKVKRSDWVFPLGLATLAGGFFLVAYLLRDDDSGTLGGLGDGALIGGLLFFVALIVWTIIEVVRASRQH
jgi:hypothetical protein